VDPRWKTVSTPQELPPVKTGGSWWKKNATGEWLNDAPSPDFGGHWGVEPSQWLGLSLLKKAIEGGPPVRCAGWSGNLQVPSKAFVDTIVATLGVRLIRVTDGGNSNGRFLFGSDVAMLSYGLSESGRWADVQLVTIDEDICRRSSLLFDRCIIPDDPKKGLVFTLVKGMGGFSISRLGAAGTPLERGNYAPPVLADYDHVVEDLSTDSPCGRLIILSGSPGTGKSYLVRSLLAAVPTTAFILVPPHLVEGLGGPEILPALTSAKNEFSGPITLIIEDADQCLVQRKEGNMNSISSMLNLGDGILGSVLDIRILATTNAEKLEMDAATRRPGRLCRYIEVGSLPAEEAAKALHRLTGEVRKFQGEATIAEVYQEARKLGWRPTEVVPARPDPRPELAY
jgi:hypothetical protein